MRCVSRIPDYGDSSSTKRKFVTASGVLAAVTIATFFLTCIQPSASSYQDRASACSDALRSVVGTVANIASIQERMDGDPHNQANLVAEANRFGDADNAVRSYCPIGLKEEYLRLLDTNYYREVATEVRMCARLTLDLSERTCGIEHFLHAQNSTVTCAERMSLDADEVSRWSGFKQWGQVIYRWWNNSDDEADSSQPTAEEYIHACRMVDVTRPELGWGEPSS